MATPAIYEEGNYEGLMRLDGDLLTDCLGILKGVLVIHANMFCEGISYYII
jgi:hypothetical protein